MASIPTQEDFLAVTRRNQEAMTAAIKKLTSVYAPLTGRLPRLPFVSLPFADKLPTPAEAVDDVYHLAERLLASQRRFTEDLLKAMAPLMPGGTASAPKTVAVAEPKTEAVAQPKPEPASAPKTEAVSSAAAKTATRPAAKSAAERPASRPAAARSTTAKSTTAKSTTARSTAAKSAPKKAPSSPAPKGTDGS